jgi:hypothetical protein
MPRTYVLGILLSADPAGPARESPALVGGSCERHDARPLLENSRVCAASTVRRSKDDLGDAPAPYPASPQSA